jgi:hypothetical protein
LQTKPVVTQKNINASGETFAFTSQLPNSEAVQSSASLYINRRLKTDPRWQVNLSGSINGSTYSNLFVINDNVGRQITSNIGSGVQGTLNYNNLIDLTTQLNAQASYTFYQNASFSRVRYFNPSTTNKLLVYLPKNFTCELIYAFTRNSQANADFQRQIHLLNSSVAWLFFKNKSGQIKLSAFDLLNNNVSVSRIAFENSIYDSENRIQKRYFLLTLLYKFKVSSKK